MKKKQIAKISSCCAILSAIVLFVLMFVVPSLTSGGDNPTTIIGKDITFGKKAGSEMLGYTYEFSFLLLIAFILPLVFGLILVILQVVGGKKNKGIKTLFGLLLCISFVASFIILIDAANVAKLTGSVLGFSGTSSFADAGYKLAWGAIVEIVLAGIGFVSSCAYTLYSAK